MVSNVSNAGVVSGPGRAATPTPTTCGPVASGRAWRSEGRDTVTLNSTAAQPSRGASSGLEIDDISGARASGDLERRQLHSQTRDALVGIIRQRADQLATLADQLA